MKNPPKMPAIERRFTSSEVKIHRMEGEDDLAKKRIRGYAAKFNEQSEDLGRKDRAGSFELREVIMPGAFDDVINDDIRALFNHDPSLILARSKNGSGSLRVGVDEVGLWYEFEAPDTQAGRDLVVSMERGDVDQSSFGFSLNEDGQKWEETREGDIRKVLRTITKVARLMDVSPVTYPAYTDTTVALRSLEQFQQEATPPPAEEPPLELWERRLRILKLTPATH